MTIVTRPSSVQSLLGGSIELPVQACGHGPAIEAAPLIAHIFWTAHSPVGATSRTPIGNANPF